MTPSPSLSRTRTERRSSSPARSPRSRPTWTRPDRTSSSAATTSRTGSTAAARRAAGPTKDSEIAATIAGEAGLSSSVDDSEIAQAYIAQPGLSDWEFLASRAREIGYDLRVADGSLEFKKPSSASDGPEQGSLDRAPTAGQIVYGENLLSFRPRVSIVDQASSFEARGWDVKAKQAVVGTAQPSNTSASIGLAQSAATAALGDKAYVRNDRLFAAEDAAKKAAAGLAASVGSTFGEAEESSSATRT